MADTPRAAQRVERMAAGVACAGAAALFVALALPVLHGQIYLDSDLGDFYVPVRAFYQQALQQGTEYLWYPYEFSGFYLHGEGQAGLYHPLNQLAYRWLPYTLAFGVEILRSYAFALLGAHLFFRRHGLPIGAALLGAIYFAFCGFQLLHYMHPNLVAATAHLPWLLLALDVLVRGGTTPLRRALAAPLYALLTASQLLLGHPQAIWLTACVEALYAAMLLVEGARAPLLRAGVAKALGVLAAAIQLLPTWDAYQHSNRAAGQGDGSFSLHPYNFAQLVQPYLFEGRVLRRHTTEFGLYAGAFGVIALLWLATRRLGSERQRRLGDGAVLLAALGGVLALGPAGYVQPWIAALPVVGAFRAACRYLFWIQLAASVAVALVFGELLRTHRTPARRRELVAALLPGLLSIALGGVLLSQLPLETRDARYAVAASVALALTGAVVVAAARGVRLALPLLAAVACADLGIYGIGYVSAREPPPATLDEVRAGIELPRVAEARVQTGPMLATLLGVRYVWGYVALFPQKQLPVLPPDRREAEGDAAWLAAMRVGSVAGPGGSRLPRARMVTRALASDSLREDIAAVDVATTALVERELVLEDDRPGRARIVAETPGEIALTTAASGRQLLVLSESFHEGWRVWIDGAPAERLRVYGDYMGCVVPGGEHRVRFHFEPESFARGRTISALALAAILAWSAVALVRSRRLGRAPVEVGGEGARGQHQV